MNLIEQICTQLRAAKLRSKKNILVVIFNCLINTGLVLKIIAFLKKYFETAQLYCVRESRLLFLPPQPMLCR